MGGNYTKYYLHKNTEYIKLTSYVYLDNYMIRGCSCSQSVLKDETHMREKK